MLSIIAALCFGVPSAGRAAPPEGAQGLSAPRTPPSRFSQEEFPDAFTPQRVAADADVQDAAPDEVVDEAAEVVAERPSTPFHVSVGFAWQRAQLRFVTPLEFAVAGCGCGMENRAADLMRGSASIGWAGLSVEGSVARSIRTPEPFTQWAVGVRLDTSYRAALSLAIGAAYVRRTGAILGEGGRASAALQLRFIRQIVIYAEGGVDVTNAPQNDETLLSYSFFYSVGLRVVLARS